MDNYEKMVMVFYQMICNAFRDEEDYDYAVEKLRIERDMDLNEMIVSMMSAIQFFCQQLNSEMFENMDLIEFTYILNRLVVQHLYGKNQGDESDG